MGALAEVRQPRGMLKIRPRAYVTARMTRALTRMLATPRRLMRLPLYNLGDMR
jgi:hypothetical protein